VIEVTEVRTADAAPVDAPHRISAQPGHDTAQVTVGVASIDPIGAWRVEPDDELRNHEPLRAGGVVCGLDRCGVRAPLQTPSPFTLRFDITQPQLVTEGDHGLDVHAAAEREGWL
jgi:hypothetical protein